MPGNVDIVGRLYAISNFLITIIITVIANIYLVLARYGIGRQICQVFKYSVSEELIAFCRAPLFMMNNIERPWKTKMVSFPRAKGSHVNAHYKRF